MNAKDENGKTALHRAAQGGNVDIVKVLIVKGADVNAKDNDGETALHWAAQEGHFEVAKVLIEKGADVGAKDKNNETAIEVAIRHGHHQIAELIEDSIKHRKTLDILDMGMDELVRLADESAKKLCRNG